MTSRNNVSNGLAVITWTFQQLSAMNYTGPQGTSSLSTSSATAGKPVTSEGSGSTNSASVSHLVTLMNAPTSTAHIKQKAWEELVSLIGYDALMFLPR